MSSIIRVELTEEEQDRISGLAIKAMDRGDAQLRGTRRPTDRAAVILYRAIEAGLDALESEAYKLQPKEAEAPK